MAATGRDPEPEFDGNFLIPPHRDAILLAALDVAQDLPAPAQRIYTTVIAATVARGYLTAPGSLGVVCVHARHPDRKNFNRYRGVLVDRGLIRYVAGDTKSTRRADGSVTAKRDYTDWTLIPPPDWSRHLGNEWFSRRSTTVPPRGYSRPEGMRDPGVSDTSTPGVSDTSTPGVRGTPQKQLEEETVARRGSQRRSSAPAPKSGTEPAAASCPVPAVPVGFDACSSDPSQASAVMDVFVGTVERDGESISPTDIARLEREAQAVLEQNGHTAGLALAALAYWWVDTERAGGKFFGSISKSIPSRVWTAYQRLGPSPTPEACLSLGAAMGKDSWLQRGSQNGAISKRKARTLRTDTNLAHWADDDDRGCTRARA